MLAKRAALLAEADDFRKFLEGIADQLRMKPCGKDPVSLDVARAVTEVRERLAALGGSLVVVKAPPHLKRQVDAWGPAGDAVGLMRRVKERFDPDHRMSPGRFVGGI